MTQGVGGDVGGDGDVGDLAARGPAAATPGALAARARAAVVVALHGCAGALGAWEAGSAAFGRADLDSDLDVGVLCAPGAGTDVLDAIEVELRRAVPDLVAWDVGRSAFGVQRFWREPAERAPGVLCMVDVSVMEHDDERALWSELLCVERHGGALAMYDPDGVLAEAVAGARLDLDAHRERMRAELARIAGRRRMFGDFPAKELARGRAIDARAMYGSMAFAPLVTLLGMRYRPLRFDFGQRYLHEELPAEVVACLEPLAAPPLDRLEAAASEAFAWIDRLLADLGDLDAIPLQAHATQMRAAFA